MMGLFVAAMVVGRIDQTYSALAAQMRDIRLPWYAITILIGIAICIFIYATLGTVYSLIPYPTAWDANHAYMFVPKFWAMNHGYHWGTPSMYEVPALWQ